MADDKQPPRTETCSCGRGQPFVLADAATSALTYCDECHPEWLTAEQRRDYARVRKAMGIRTAAAARGFQIGV